MAEWETYWLKLPRGTKGAPGNDGTASDTGIWVTATPYSTGDRCYHAKTGHGQCVYRCKTGKDHTSGATTEPEVGASWATYWELFAEGGSDGAGSGDFVGPASAITDNLVSYADVTGKRGKDSGIPAGAVNFNGLTEKTTDSDRDADFIKIYEASSATYKKIHPDKLGRKTESIILTAQGMWPIIFSGCLPSTNVETPTVKSYISALPFSDVGTSYAECDFILPWYYDGGTITARFHWFVPTTTAGTVVFGIRGRVMGDGDNLDVIDGTPQIISDATHVTAYDLMITEPTPAITLAGTPAGAKACVLIIYRESSNESDTLAEIVYLKGIEIRYGCIE